MVGGRGADFRERAHVLAYTAGGRRRAAASSRRTSPLSSSPPSAAGAPAAAATGARLVAGRRLRPRRIRPEAPTMRCSGGGGSTAATVRPPCRRRGCHKGARARQPAGDGSVAARAAQSVTREAAAAAAGDGCSSAVGGGLCRLCGDARTRGVGSPPLCACRAAAVRWSVGSW